MIRRFKSCALATLLGLALLLAQLGGVRHELSHWPSPGLQSAPHAASSLPSHDSGDAADLACHLCGLYAQLAHALNTTPLTAPGEMLPASSPIRLGTAFEPPAPSRIKIRGPPSLS